MGVGSGGQCPTWIFIHGANMVDRDLKVLFFGLFCCFYGLFFVAPPPRKIFCRRPCIGFGLLNILDEACEEVKANCNQMTGRVRGGFKC